MKILIVTEVFFPENFIINDLAQQLVQKGYQIEVMTRQPSYPEGYVYPPYKNDNYSREIWNGITIHRINTIEGYKHSKIKKVQNYANYVRVGTKLIDSLISGVDVILVNQTGPLTLALPAVHARKLRNIPVIIWTFDIWPDAVYAYGFPRIFPFSTYIGRIIRKVYRNVDEIMVSSRRFADTVSKYAPDKTVSYIPNWLIEGAEESSQLRLDTDKVNFTFTGNISISQNLDKTIKGFVRAAIPNAVLNIVGDGSTLVKHKRLVEQLKCENVLFHGRQPYSQIHDILIQSDYLVLPLVTTAGIDKTEPFKIQSYLKSGKPILGIIEGSGQEIIEENSLGICANPNDINDIAQGFKAMTELSGPELEEIALSCEKLLQIRYSRERTINNIETIIKRVLKDSLH